MKKRGASIAHGGTPDYFNGRMKMMGGTLHLYLKPDFKFKSKYSGYSFYFRQLIQKRPVFLHDLHIVMYLKP